MKNIRKNDNFLFFFETVKKVASEINQAEELALQAKQIRQNFSILIHAEVCKTGKEIYLKTAANYFMLVYFEALGAVFNLIKDRINQPGY